MPPMASGAGVHAVITITDVINRLLRLLLDRRLPLTKS